MANSPNPEYLSEVMFQEHGTKVLITNPAADVYLNNKKNPKNKEEESSVNQKPLWYYDND